MYDVFTSLTPSVYAESASTAIEKEVTWLWDNWDNEKMNAKQLLSAADKALKKYPITKHKESYLLLEISAFANFELNNNAIVEKQATTIIKYAPKEFYGYFLLGGAQYNLDKYAAAEKNLKKSISLNSEFGATYDYLGSVYAKTKKYNAAATNSMRAVMLEPYALAPYSGYEGDKVYENQLLGFSLNTKPTFTYPDKESLSELLDKAYKADRKKMMDNPSLFFESSMILNEIYLQEDENKLLYISIEADLYKDAKAVASSKQLCEEYIKNFKENNQDSISNLSSVTSTMLGKQEFSSFSYDKTVDDKTYKSQCFVLSRDGVVTIFSIWAQNPDDISKGRAVLDTYKSY